MRFSEKWLREWVNPPVSTDELVAQLTGAGLEVDAVEPAAPDLPGVVVGKVLSVAPHPNADRLTVCTVDIGGQTPLAVVCGASNVREDLRVPVASAGARLADGSRMKPSKIRGTESSGMLCSARELGLSESAQGLMELPADAPVGESLSDYLALDDMAIEIDLTPNRGDCLSIAGIAREVGVLDRCPVSPPAMARVPASIPDAFPVTLESPADCPRYVGRVIRNIDIRAPSPIRMQERLRRSGIRSINPVVDVTNYVMLELGQPMHAFDPDTLSDTIRVRRANQGETLLLLDGMQVTLHPSTLVIADAHRPIALAGIMGGADTAVTGKTRHIFLESAFFTPRALAGQARRYALHTDASHRFERGVDWELQRAATERATALLIEIAGGEPGPVVEALSQPDLPRPRPVRLRSSRLQRVLGIPFAAAPVPANAVSAHPVSAPSVSVDTVSDVLTRLGMVTVAGTAAGDGKTWDVTPPSFRFDIALEADLIEEVARVTGYDTIPARRPVLPVSSHKPADATVSLARMRQVLVERGYREAITYSFVDPELVSLIDPDASSLALQNPISSEMAVMRTTLLPGLVQAVMHNLRRQQPRIRLFESGLVFNRQGDELLQERVLGAIATGSAFAEQWGIPARSVDFFDVKSDVEGLLSLTGRSREYRFVRFSHPALHPGQSARIERDGRPIGWIGNLHPRIGRELKLGGTPGGNTLAFQIKLTELESGTQPEYIPLSKFPAVRRDIALIVNKNVSSYSVQECIRRAASDRLKNDALKSITLFDEYCGDGIDAEKKSLAFGLLFQEASRTLQDTEIDKLVAGVMTVLQDRLDAIPRTY
uniref:Phenylalanine--tRNA ligase beta subunit n=1 Tax=Candidatus Kentrum sp. FM TaxID=2126340 RepID=A0A450SI56_9GAMM|nr:MAG: phenylalanyl-tRNA synthetase beta chain [Candidatus Kentron sp. FM]VFJ66417.1 MAG: phenylalanyl-tRNA synthetase beta chain [Candidatus Kentron sp. FM]VFK14188.1 MAG: phenylalanyl-tRNA synthetase beta chain [Candidatus Kentron sp. FM]